MFGSFVLRSVAISYNILDYYYTVMYFESKSEIRLGNSIQRHVYT